MEGGCTGVAREDGSVVVFVLTDRCSSGAVEKRTATG